VLGYDGTEWLPINQSGGGGGCSNAITALAQDVTVSSVTGCNQAPNAVVAGIGTGLSNVPIHSNSLTYDSSTTPSFLYSGTNLWQFQSTNGEIAFATGSSSPFVVNAGTWTELKYSGNLEWYAGALVGQPTVGAFYSGLVTPSAVNFALAANATATNVNSTTETGLYIGGSPIVTATASLVTINPSAETNIQVGGTSVAQFEAAQVNLNSASVNLANSSTAYFQVLPTGTKGSHIAFSNPAVTSVGISTGPYCGTGGPAAVKLYITVAGADYALPLCNP
jgi:hypothetical protein